MGEEGDVAVRETLCKERERERERATEERKKEEKEERRGETLSRHITTSPSRSGPCGTASAADGQADPSVQRRHRR